MPAKAKKRLIDQLQGFEKQKEVYKTVRLLGKPKL
jgi:hypothetical protein